MPRGGCSRYPVCGRRINEGPGTFLEEPRAFYMLARLGKARSPCLYASDARLCPVRRAGSMGANERTYRLYSCGCCAKQVRICCDCDRGNRYCAGECARERRRESLRRASERYQQSYRGACNHAARQRALRRRHAQKVTHQGSLPSADTPIVAAIPTQTTTQGSHADIASIQPPAHGVARVALSAAHRRAQVRWPAHRVALSVHRCSFCWRALPPLARLGPLRAGP